jgi:rubrerythrin
MDWTRTDGETNAQMKGSSTMRAMTMPLTTTTTRRRRSVVVEAAGGSRFNKKAAAAPGKPAPGEPYLVDGKLWVCQGCGYVYDGSKGAWAENKRCPMCGERRFALKTQGEMQLAIYSLVAAVALVGVLFVIPSL